MLLGICGAGRCVAGACLAPRRFPCAASRSRISPWKARRRHARPGHKLMPRALQHAPQLCTCRPPPAACAWFVHVQAGRCIRSPRDPASHPPHTPPCGRTACAPFALHALPCKRTHTPHTYPLPPPPPTPHTRARTRTLLMSSMHSAADDTYCAMVVASPLPHTPHPKPARRGAARGNEPLKSVGFSSPNTSQG